MEGPSLKLIIEKGPRSGESLEFTPRSAIRIGRLVRGNNLTIRDSGISSKHLSIQFESGKWVIRDLGSSNGTLLNNVPLPPDNPADLRDSDNIKIGELTSITVRIVECDERQLRRNPRRRGAGREGELDALGSVAENRGRREPSKRVRVLKEEASETDLASVSEVGFGEKLVSDVVVVENRGRRGRKKKAQALKNEDLRESHEVQEREESLDLVKELENVGQGGVEPVWQTGSRSTRVSEKQDNLVSCSMLQEIPESSKLDGGNVGVVGKRTRMGLRSKRNVQDEPTETVVLDGSEKNKLVEGSNHGEKICKQPASASGAKQSSTEEGNEPDLEKMTLGEWFDFLELHLSRQIYNVTEEMISSMRERGERVREYMLQQRDEKGELPICQREDGLTDYSVVTT